MSYVFGLRNYAFFSERATFSTDFEEFRVRQRSLRTLKSLRSLESLRSLKSLRTLKSLLPSPQKNGGRFLFRRPTKNLVTYIFFDKYACSNSIKQQYMTIS